MALRLSMALGRSAESWLAMQGQYNLWQTRKSVDLKDVKKVKLSVAYVVDLSHESNLAKDKREAEATGLAITRA